MLTVQARPLILTTKRSYSGLTFEKLVIVNAIRRETFHPRVRHSVKESFYL
jgi:hypothetical protein